jgi:hypothetical protein
MSTNDYLKQETIVPDNEYTNVPIQEYGYEPFGQDDFHHDDINGNVRSGKQVRYRYSYGFDNIIAAQMSMNRTAGYISEPINVKDCLYIELNANIVDGVEYSIIDGKTETPILPLEQSFVKGERLFYGLMPRFFIVNPNDVIVRHNGETLGIGSLEDLELFLSVNNTEQETGQSFFLREEIYTIDYEPDTRARIYYPKNDTIKVKIVQRILNPGDVPIPIESVTIRKHGNQSSWYLSSSDESPDYDSSDIRNS